MDAYEYLVEKYAGALHGLVRQMIPDNEQVTAVLKESFVNISTSVQQYDSTKCRLFTWMMQTTRETALKKLKELNLRTLPAESQNENTANVIGRLSNKLDKEEQQLVELSYFKGFSAGDLATRLNIPEDTVRTKLKMALSHLNTLR